MTIPGIQKPNILQVVQAAGIELRQRGARFWGICPFHSEKTPSFSVDPEKQRWKCFGCGAGGDAIDFIRKLKGLSFKAAVSLLRIPDGHRLIRGNREHKVDPLVTRRNKLQQAFQAWADFTIRDLQDLLLMCNLVDSVITKGEHLGIAGLGSVYLEREVFEYELSVLTNNDLPAKVALYRKGALCHTN